MKRQYVFFYNETLKLGKWYRIQGEAKKSRKKEQGNKSSRISVKDWALEKLKTRKV